MRYPTLLLAFATASLLANIAYGQKPLDYKSAYKMAQKGDKPLLVLVTSQRCPPCQQMKRDTFPKLLAKNALKDCYWANVDVDAEPNLAGQLTEGIGYPQLLIFEKRNGKWFRRRHAGFMSADKVEAFVAKSPLIRTAQNTAKVTKPGVKTK